MTLIALISSTDWDLPFFKVLANNDTGAASGHQGGIVIPMELRPFFPGLSDATSPWNPTTDQRIDADLFVENRFLASVSTRYQYQTWGGTRSPESRLTDQLAPLRNLAHGGDILIFQRSIDRLDKYCLTLVRQSSDEFGALQGLVAGRRWGILSAATPMSDDELATALNQEQQRESSDFSLVDDEALQVESRVFRIARSVAFRLSVTRLYGYTCAVCGESLKSPRGMLELDAAHIVPRSRLGADDARNGLALCKRHHWAFDGGLFGIGSQREIIVPDTVMQIPANAVLANFNGRSIREAGQPHLRAHADALAWHRENILLQD
ncbi:MAG: HNH endonuclease [Gallionella sp.]